MFKQRPMALPWEWLVTGLLVKNDLFRVEMWINAKWVYDIRGADSPEATVQRGAAQLAIANVRAQINRPSTMLHRFEEGLRNMSQGLLKVRQKLDRLDSLAVSLEHTIGGTQSARVLSATLRDAVIQRGVHPPDLLFLKFWIRWKLSKSCF